MPLSRKIMGQDKATSPQQQLRALYAYSSWMNKLFSLGFTILFNTKFISGPRAILIRKYNIKALG
jgi:hypothetical protein